MLRRTVIDEVLPLGAQTFDLAVSALALQSVNDLPGFREVLHPVAVLNLRVHLGHAVHDDANKQVQHDHRAQHDKADEVKDGRQP